MNIILVVDVDTHKHIYTNTRKVVDEEAVSVKQVVQIHSGHTNFGFFVSRNKRWMCAFGQAEIIIRAT